MDIYYSDGYLPHANIELLYFKMYIWTTITWQVGKTPGLQQLRSGLKQAKTRISSREMVMKICKNVAYAQVNLCLFVQYIIYPVNLYNICVYVYIYIYIYIYVYTHKHKYIYIYVFTPSGKL